MNKHLAGALVVAATKIPMSQLQAQEAPQIFAGANGEIEATFNNNCMVYYRANGERREANSNCSRGQVERADTGVGAYRREQGAEAMPVAKRLPVDSAIPTSTSARLKLSWTITGERMFSSDRAVSYIILWPQRRPA